MKVAGRDYRPLVIAGWLAAVALLSIVVVRGRAPWADITYVLIAASVTVAAWLGAVRLRERPERTVAFLLATGLTLASVADLIAIVLGWQAGSEPDISFAEIPWLLSYVFLGAALLRLLRRVRQDLDGLIDVAGVFIAGMLVLWVMIGDETVTDTSLPLAVRVVWSLYPALDMALLALAIRVIMRDRTLSSVLLAAAASVWLVTDFAYLASTDPAYDGLLDAGWLWAMALAALAIIAGPRSGPRLGRRPEDTDEIGMGRVLIALLPLLLPSVIFFVRSLWEGDRLSTWGTAAAAVVLLSLAIVRMHRLAQTARQARAALVRQERYARALAAHASDAVIVVDAQLRMTGDFPQLAHLVGYPGRSFRGADVGKLILRADLPKARAAARRCLANPGECGELEVRIRHGEGHSMWLGARMTNLLHNPDVRGIVINLRDISDRKAAEEELAHQAFHDPLTGLANRVLFRQRLDRALAARALTGACPSVIFLDLDGFKPINDSLGHDAGDDLLRVVAARLTGAVRHSDTVGRLGGDEFAILLEDSSQPLAEAVAVAERVSRVVREPVHLDGNAVRVSASLGIAVGDATVSAAHLLRHADHAMYRSKLTGKDRWTVHSPGMRAPERIEPPG